MPAGATVGGKTEAEIGAEVQAALAAGDKGKLESIMDSLHNAGYSGSFNASQEFKDAGVSNKSMGIVPASVAASPAATAAYVEENQMGASTTASTAAQTGEPDYLNYILNNPGLRESAEAMGYTQQEMIDMGDWHWNTYGKNESRRNTPFKTELPGERTALPNPHDIANFEASVRRGDPSAMWTARSDIDPAWNLGQFSGTGWNFDPDNPYGRGILGDTIAVDAPVGQLYDTGDPLFLQDRYQDPYIAEDFPVGWTTPQNTWAGPEQLGGYWDAITNAQRNELGELRSVVGRPETGWAGPSVSPGTRGGGNVRVGGLLGPPNPTVPSFGYSQYQDWTRFMPTNFQLAEGAGMHYQPWASGMPASGSYANDVVYGPILTPPGGGGGTTTGPGVINPNIWGNTDTTSSSNTTTDSSGNRWVMSPGGQWYPATSDYGQGLLGTGRLHPDPNFYDSSGAYVGAEGEGVRSQQYGSAGTPWQDIPGLNTIMTNQGYNPTYPGVTNPLAPGFTTSTAPGYDYTMTLPANTAYNQPTTPAVSPYNAYSELGLLGIQASPGHVMDVTSQMDSFANMQNAAWETAARETEAMMEAEANVEAMSSGGGHASKEMM